MSRKVTRNYEFSACSANYFCFCLGSVALCLIRFDLRGGASWIPAWSTLAVGLKGNACNVFFIIAQHPNYTVPVLFARSVSWRLLATFVGKKMANNGFDWL